MSYRARGDYLRGYSRGDPGFLGAIGHIIGGATKGFLKAGPLGAVFGAGAGTVAAVKSGLSPGRDVVGAGQDPESLVLKHQLNVAHAQKKIAATHPIGGNPAGTPHGGPKHAVAGFAGEMGARGYHPDKKTHTYMVRNRSMNPYNPRALHRAERRLGRFVKMATHLIKWVHPHKTGRAVPKFGGARGGKRK